MSDPEVTVKISITVKGTYGQYTLQVEQQHDGGGQSVQEQVSAGLTAAAELTREWILARPAAGDRP
jgi:hypothetical protein